MHMCNDLIKKAHWTKNKSYYVLSMPGRYTAPTNVPSIQITVT